MRKFICFLFCLALSIDASAQAPQLHLTLGGGILRPFESIDDPYKHYRNRNSGISALGIGAEFDLTQKVSFAPEVGFEVFQFRYAYSGRVGYAASNISKLTLGSIRIAPSFEFNVQKHVFVRAGITGLIAAGGTGRYVIDWIQYGTVQREVHTDHFSKIRKFGNIGPELAIGYRFSTRGGRDLSLRLGGFIGVIPAFKPHPYAPMNPYTSRLNLEVSYALSRRD